METHDRRVLAAESDEASVDQLVVDGGFLLRRSTPEDDAELLALFHRAFRPSAETVRDANSWDWRYKQSAARTQSCIAVELESGCVVGHVGGRSHSTLWTGRRRRSVECVDDMIDLRVRRGLRRSNLFVELKLFWVEQFCGADKNVFGWGFPNEVAFRIGRHAAGYRRILDVTTLVCRREDRLRASVSGVEVRPVSAVSEDADILFENCGAELSMSLVRDRDYLSGRYSACPGRPYAVLEARDKNTGELRGIQVLRRGGIARDVAMLMDWIVPLRDDATATALLDAAAGFVRDRGLGALVAWFPRETGHFRAFVDRGFEPTRSPMFLAGRSWDPHTAVEEIARSLYMTFGDMDSY